VSAPKYAYELQIFSDVPSLSTAGRIEVVTNGTDAEVEAIAELVELLAPFDQRTRLRMFTYVDDRLQCEGRKRKARDRELEQLEHGRELESDG
jgi:acylphosphatase